MTQTLSRAVLLLFYAAALLSLYQDWPPLLEAVLQYGTLLCLVAHVIETVVNFRWVRMYEGPLVVSILLTLLFGILHWMPYKKRAGAAAGG